MLKLRNINKPAGNVYSYPSPQFNRKITDDRTDIKTHSRDLKTDSANRFKKKNINIVNYEGEPIYYYRKLMSGRRCSCFDGYPTPSGDCPICHKTGIVGGFLKYGTYQNILDSTAFSVDLINIHPSLELQLRPLNFILDEGATKGFINFTFDILQQNSRIVDSMLFLYSGTNKNATVILYVKRPSESVFVVGSKENIQSRLDEEHLNFRISVNRSHPDIPSPKISHFMLRYNIIPDVRLFMDIANTTQGTSLDELGLIQNFQLASAFFHSGLGALSSQDFLLRLDDNSLWKPVDLRLQKSVGIMTCVELNLRLIQNFESYRSFPL